MQHQQELRFGHRSDGATGRMSRFRLSLKWSVALMTAVLSLTPAQAGYNANMTGVVTEVLTYLDSTMILFRLDNQPTTHPLCNPVYFAVNVATDSEVRKQVLARLLVAKATGESVNIGYDNAADCSHSYIRAWRVG
jgi:hypothetical protein